MWDTPISPSPVSTFTSFADARTGSLNSGGFTGMFARSTISILVIFINPPLFAEFDGALWIERSAVSGVNSYRHGSRIPRLDQTSMPRSKQLVDFHPHRFDALKILKT
jgi:hypothetical protein